VDLVDEEDAAGAEAGKEEDELLRLLQQRPHGRVEWGVELPGDQACEGGLAQARRAAEEKMPQGLAAGARRRDRELEVRDEAPLAGEVGEAVGARGAARGAIRFLQVVAVGHLPIASGPRAGPLRE
jgi:hypothetical protein